MANMLRMMVATLVAALCAFRSPRRCAHGSAWLRVGALAGGLAFLAGCATAAPTTPPTPTKPLSLEITTAVLANPQTIRIEARTTLPDQAEVRAVLSDGSRPFPWNDAARAVGRVQSGDVTIVLRRVDNAPTPAKGVTYTITLSAETNGQSIADSEPLEIPAIYRAPFYGETPVAQQPSATRAPTATLPPTPTGPTATPAPTADIPFVAAVPPSPVPATPSTEVVSVTVLTNAVIRSEPRQAPNNIVDQVAAGESVALIGKTADGQWYLIAMPRDNEGWIEVGALALTDEIVNRVPVQNTPGPAVNGTPVPGAPGGTASPLAETNVPAATASPGRSAP